MITVRYRDHEGKEQVRELNQEQAQAFFDKYYDIALAHHGCATRRDGYRPDATQIEVALGGSLTVGYWKYMTPLQDAASEGELPL